MKNEKRGEEERRSGGLRRGGADEQMSRGGLERELGEVRRK